MQHNSQATDGSKFIDGDAYITTFQGTSWSSSTASNFISPGLHEKSGLEVTNFSGNDMSYFTKASDASALPVVLVSFSARAEQQQVMLRWQTSQEITADYFDVERL